MDESIFFQESSSDSAEFLHELSDPNLLRPPSFSPAAAIQLRKEQVRKLQENIRVLRKKQAEFNDKMEDYIANLNRLIESLERSITTDLSRVPADGAHSGATHVRCLKCE